MRWLHYLVIYPLAAAGLVLVLGIVVCTVEYMKNARRAHEFEGEFVAAPADLKAMAEHSRYQADFAEAVQHAKRTGHTEADGMTNYDDLSSYGIQRRHRGPNGHDAPGPWERCEWPSHDTARH